MNPIETSLTYDFDSNIKNLTSTYNEKLKPEVKFLFESWAKIHEEYTINPSLLTSILMFNPRSLKKFYEVYG